MIPVTEIFDSIQCEIDIGLPSTFVRVSGCDMQPLCKYCDSKHAWKGGTNYTPRQLTDTLKTHKMPQIVWTGGSPSLYFKDILNCMRDLDMFDHSLETNGLVFDINVVPFFKRISVSPKRQNVNIEALKEFAKLSQARFKFIYEPSKSFWWEEVIEKAGIDKSKVYIMPLGADKAEHQRNVFKALEYCKQTGFNLAPRVHIMLWGKRRRV